MTQMDATRTTPGQPAGRSPIFLISGPPGSGKTTVARALMERFPQSVHYSIDDLRKRVVGGYSAETPLWSGAPSPQFELARRTAAFAARLYNEAGYAVAIDDVIFPEDAQTCIIVPLEACPLHKILLHPRLEVALARNARRQNKSFDTSDLTGPIRQIHRSLDPARFASDGWITIDNSDMHCDDTVQEILRRTA